MAVSGSVAFTLDFTDVAEEAFERIGKTVRTGLDLRTARRSMNLLCIEWQNRGVNLWTIEEQSLSLLTGQSTYDIPADTVDVFEHVIRTDAGDVSLQSDLSVTRINASGYATIPNKLTRGRPLQMYVDRQRDNPKVTFWPVPESDNYTLVYWRIRRVMDAGDGGETPDMPYRFFPALVSGLAYYLALKDPALAQMVPMLQQEYERQFNLAGEEDREKTPMRMVPGR